MSHMRRFRLPHFAWKYSPDPMRGFTRRFTNLPIVRGEGRPQARMTVRMLEWKRSARQGGCGPDTCPRGLPGHEEERPAAVLADHPHAVQPRNGLRRRAVDGTGGLTPAAGGASPEQARGAAGAGFTAPARSGGTASGPGTRAPRAARVPLWRPQSRIGRSAATTVKIRLRVRTTTSTPRWSSAMKAAVPASGTVLDSPRVFA